MNTENQNQGGFYPFVLHKISVLTEPATVSLWKL